VTSDAGWSQSFTLLKLSPTLFWENDERPEAFAGTVRVLREEDKEEEEETESDEASRQDAIQDAVASGVQDTLDSGEVSERVVSGGNVSENKALGEESGEAFTDETPSGEHFPAWLRRRLLERKLVINDAKALVHTVADMVYLVSPEVFQRYVQEHPQTAFLARQDRLADWQWVQRRFEKLGVHRKQPKGLNIWTCEVARPRKSRRVHGYLLENPKALFSEPPPNNPYLILLGEDEE
jgi:hypothetical protein